MEEIGSQFLAKVRFLTYCLKLRSLGDDPAQLEELQDVEKEIRFLETSLREMKRKLHQEQQALQESKELAAALEMNAARIEHMEQNMPSKLPAPKQLNTSFTISSSSSSSVHNNNTSTLVLSTVVSQQESTRPQTGSKQSQQKGPAKKNQLAPLSKIAYVKVDEFKDVPAYVKGRITREYVNEMVDCIHNTLESKHKILSMPRHSMGDSMMRKYKAFKEAETGETQGLHFFIDGDVESMKIDSSWRAGLATLRTLKRIKEVRGGGIIRYAMI